MKEERLLRLLGQVDEEWIEEAASERKKGRNRPWGIWLSVAACFLLAAFFGIGVWQGGWRDKTPGLSTGDQRWPEKGISQTTGSGETARIPPWEEMPVSRQYAEVHYHTALYVSQVSEIAAGEIGNALESVTVEGYDIYTDTVYTANASLFAINRISTDCAVALKFEGRTEYYVYVNHAYSPATLGGFIDDLNLTENISFGSVWYEWTDASGKTETIEFVGLEASAVWQMLLDEPGTRAVTDTGSFRNRMSVSVDIPLLGCENISLGITDDGYLTTNILGTGKAFYIGEEKGKRFQEYVIENCEGYKIVDVQSSPAVPE